MTHLPDMQGVGNPYCGKEGFLLEIVLNKKGQ